MGFDNDDELRQHLEDNHPVEMASESFNDDTAEQLESNDECDDEMMKNLLCGNMVQVNMEKEDEPEPPNVRQAVPTPEQGLEVLRNIPSLSIRPVVRNAVQDKPRCSTSVPLSIREVVKPSQKMQYRLTSQALPEHLQEIVPPPTKRPSDFAFKTLPKAKMPKDNSTASPSRVQPSEAFVKAMMSIIAPRIPRDSSTVRICVLCSKSFNDDKSLLGHHVKHLSDSLLCFACHRTFVTNDDYTAHLALHEAEENQGIYKAKPCFICNASFSQYDELITHVRNHRPMFICKHCDQKYARKRDLDIHVYTLAMKCPMCALEFPCQGLYKSHIRSHNARHECVLCEKTFTTKEALDNHDATFHNNPKSFPCPMCDASFTQIALLQAHLASFQHDQSSDKLWICEVCQRGFSSMKYLKTHMKSHAANTGNECDLCGETVGQDLLDEHILKVHGVSSALSCPICSTVLENRKVLQKHMRQHTGEDLFACTICGKTFGQKRSLISHRKLHTDGLPYECEICGMAFRVPSTMYRHIQVHHPESTSSIPSMQDGEEDPETEMLRVEVEITEGTEGDISHSEPDTLLVFKTN